MLGRKKPLNIRNENQGFIENAKNQSCCSTLYYCSIVASEKKNLMIFIPFD